MDFSIITPCYNHGKYLPDMLQSLKPISGIDYEIIIVNDGSTDKETNNILNNLKSNYSEIKLTVISQENGGPAKARNTAIKASSGKYILPIDSDNWIDLEYIIQSKKILDENSNIGIVYAKPIFVGENIPDNRRWKTLDFSIEALCEWNFIDNCAVFRKEVWEKNNGFDTNTAWEDWDFWLSAYKNAFDFYFIDAYLFYYRVLPNSNVEKDQLRVENAIKLLKKKHANLMLTVLEDKYNNLKREAAKKTILNNMYLNDFKNPFRSFFKYLKYYISGRVPEIFEEEQSRVNF